MAQRKTETTVVILDACSTTACLQHKPPIMSLLNQLSSRSHSEAVATSSVCCLCKYRLGPFCQLLISSEPRCEHTQHQTKQTIASQVSRSWSLSGPGPWGHLGPERRCCSTNDRKHQLSLKVVWLVESIYGEVTDLGRSLHLGPQQTELTNCVCL